MTRNIRKEIYTRSRCRNKFCKNPTQENKNLCKKQKNKCIALKRKCIKKYYHSIIDNNIITYKTFWNSIGAFLVNNGSLNSSRIMLRKL